ncbi:solute carrier family 23 protein [Parendozoicomonas sp. Alg238-R29]|uniref:solute carrier family 23 protein n=1 Tax=Parendozoicomonas sp. Alg238-R29 TaxID=2993446 RepID=UPI00248EA2E9|nr:solute carrier family 23 protein [Parendozoicomonas sp. Alg238-R29]
MELQYLLLVAHKTLGVFGTIATSGIRIIASEKIDKRGILILAASFGLGLGVSYVPDIFNYMPPIIKSIFSSGFTTAAITAMVLNLVVPDKKYAIDESPVDYSENQAA